MKGGRRWSPADGTRWQAANANWGEPRGLRTLAPVVSVERIAMAYNNVYFVSDADDLVVIDTGPDYRGARETLLAALAGRTPALVVATHGHLDHSGLGAWWQGRGVPVLAGEADIAQTLGHTDRDIDDLEEFVATCGAPALVVAEVQAGLEQRRLWSHQMRTASAWREPGDGRWPTALLYPAFQPLQPVSGSVELACGLVVAPAPGHTPGNLVVLHHMEGLLFSGDTLLPEITPTPAVQFHEGERFPSLPRFLESLQHLAAEPRWQTCYPGHGEPFANVHDVISANLDQARTRTERLRHDLRETGPSSLYALAERMYPRALRRRFWQIVSTVQGHLDVLDEAGEARFAGGLWMA